MTGIKDKLSRLVSSFRNIKDVWKNVSGITTETFTSLVDSVINYSIGEIDKKINSGGLSESSRNSFINVIRDSYDCMTSVNVYGSNVASNSATFRDNISLLVAETKQCEKFVIDTFNGCYSLIMVDSLDLSDVLSAKRMFYNCRSLKYIDSSDYSLQKCTDINSMFYGCNTIENIDVSNWDISNVTNMSSVFSNCKSLTSLDMSNWNTAKTTTFSYMFDECCSLTSISDIKFVGTPTQLNNMFRGCILLETLDVSRFDTSRCTDIHEMFSRCENLTTVGDISNWDVSKVALFNSVFNACNVLSVNISDWDTSSGTSFNTMFANTTLINNVKITLSKDGLNKINTKTNELFSSNSNGNTLYQMFYNSNVTNVDFQGSNVIKFDCYFNTQGWQNLNLSSITSFIENCLYDYSDDDGAHYFIVSSAMYAQLEMEMYDEDENIDYISYLALIGWSAEL